MSLSKTRRLAGCCRPFLEEAVASPFTFGNDVRQATEGERVMEQPKTHEAQNGPGNVQSGDKELLDKHVYRCEHCRCCCAQNAGVSIVICYISPEEAAAMVGG